VSSPEFDVVIVGAGIAGGALVRALQGSQLNLALIEANPIAAARANPAPGVAGFDARVSAITPASQRLLESLGSWDAVSAQRLCPYRHMQVWDAEGTGQIEFDAGELDVPELGHIVENRVLTSALLEDVASLPGVSLFNPARLQALQPEPNDRHRLLLEDGRELTAGLVVAADGALSRVRDLAAFQTREWDYGHHAMVATVETEHFHEATAYQRFMPSGPLAFLPLPSQAGQHFCSIVWSLDSGLVENLQDLPEAEFLAQLGRACEHRLGDLLAVSQRVAFPLRQRHAVDYVQPGIALVGDAAHTIHPLAGQGINLGLQDVAILAQELKRGVAAGLQVGDLRLLKRYQRQRKGENLAMMAAMDGFKRLYSNQSLPLRWLRNTGMRLVGSAAPLKHQLMRQAMGIR
jgi:2-octaprenylphenol hydroxylase